MGAFVTLWDNDAGSKIHLLANPGQDVAPIGAARQEDSLLESQMLSSLQYPHNLPLGPCGDLRRHGAQHQHRPCGLPAPQLHRGMPLSGVSTRSGDLARFTFKALDGTMTDVFIHLIAYQLATLSGTGVSVLD